MLKVILFLLSCSFSLAGPETIKSKAQKAAQWSQDNCDYISKLRKKEQRTSKEQDFLNFYFEQQEIILKYLESKRP